MARRKLYYIADGQTVQGVATPGPITTNSSTAAIDFEGGNAAFAIAGTVGGGTYSLEMLLPDGSTWAALGTNTNLTVVGVAGFSAPAGKLRVTSTGSAAASVKAWVIGIPTNNAG